MDGNKITFLTVDRHIAKSFTKAFCYEHTFFLENRLLILNYYSLRRKKLLKVKKIDCAKAHSVHPAVTPMNRTEKSIKHFILICVFTI